MNEVEIYDPGKHNSKGASEPDVDNEYLRVIAVIKTLVKEGKTISRYGLSENPQAFVDNNLINEVLLNEGAEALPITLVDGEIKKKGSYPSNAELSTWSGMTQSELIKLLFKSQIAGGDCGGSCGGCC